MKSNWGFSTHTLPHTKPKKNLHTFTSLKESLITNRNSAKSLCKYLSGCPYFLPTPNKTNVVHRSPWFSFTNSPLSYRSPLMPSPPPPLVLNFGFAPIFFLRGPRLSRLRGKLPRIDTTDSVPGVCWMGKEIEGQNISLGRGIIKWCVISYGIFLKFVWFKFKVSLKIRNLNYSNEINLFGVLF